MSTTEVGNLTEENPYGNSLTALIRADIASTAHGLDWKALRLPVEESRHMSKKCLHPELWSSRVYKDKDHKMGRVLGT